MKKMTKIASLVLALVMLVVMAAPVFAVNTEETPNSNAHTIIIGNTNDKHTFEAYQIFRGDIADGKLTNITWGNGVNGDALLTALKADSKIGADFIDCTDAASAAEVLAGYADNSEKLDAFALIAGENLTSTYATSSFKEGVCSINVTGDGYYLVKDKDGSLDNAGLERYTKYILKVVGDVEVEAKTTTITGEKFIVDAEGNRVKVNNGSIGEVVNFEWTSTIPAMDGYKEFYFVFYDTMTSGMTFNGTVEVKIDGQVLTPDVLDEEGNVVTEGDYALIIEGKHAFHVEFHNFIQYKDMTDAPIVITYSATINEEASMTEPEVNKAWFEMSKDPYNPGEVLGKSPESETKTYSTGLKLTKTDDEGKILTGAKFKIEGTSVKVTVINEEIYVEDPNGTFYQLKDSTYTEQAPVFEEEGYNADKYASTTIKYSKVINVTQTTAEQAVVAEGWVNADGIITFKGLGEGTYTITELVAPNGYNLLEEPITITIEFDYNKDTRVATWTVKRDGQELTADENGLFNFTVINKSGVVLPSTGGIGTTIFYVVGAALALCAVVLLVTRKRMSVEG